MKVVSVPGTAQLDVRRVLSELGAQIHFVNSVQEGSEIDFDAALLLGGCDISPALYGARNVASVGCDARRDQIEAIVARRAIAKGAPLMGICRGHQMLGVVSGVRLIQDIAPHHPSSHPVEILEPLSEHVPCRIVNSYHHQAIAHVPAGFMVVASFSGTIEAIWRPGILGVQFHPEWLGWVSVFEWFLQGLE